VEENQKRSGAEFKAEGEGKTLAEAETEAFSRLEEIAGPCEWDQVAFTVISEGSKGFLGMGTAVARVEARLKDSGESKADAVAISTESAIASEAEARLKELLEKVAAALGLEATVNITDTDDEIVADLVGDDLGLFIGRHGSTLDAVQYLSNIIVFRGLEGRKRVIIDAEDYRDRREEVLRSLADRAASEVMKGKLEYEMKPMSAAERRIIHIHLQDRDDVETTSEGREPFRRVIITRVED
jgi:spoIIIJ-associated protein